MQSFIIKTNRKRLDHMSYVALSRQLSAQNVSHLYDAMMRAITIDNDKDVATLRQLCASLNYTLTPIKD